METFSALLALYVGNSTAPVNSPHKGQWRGALMFSLICSLNKRSSKQSWGWWFEMPPSSLWRNYNVVNICKTYSAIVHWCTSWNIIQYCINTYVDTSDGVGESCRFHSSKLIFIGTVSILDFNVSGGIPDGFWTNYMEKLEIWHMIVGLLLGLHPAIERRRYFVTTSLIGWAQAWNQACNWVLFTRIHDMNLWRQTRA